VQTNTTRLLLAFRKVTWCNFSLQNTTKTLDYLIIITYTRITTGPSVWYEIWGGRGSGFENFRVVGPNNLSDGGTPYVAHD